MGIPGFNKSGFRLSWNGFDWTRIEVNNFEENFMENIKSFCFSGIFTTTKLLR